MRSSLALLLSAAACASIGPMRSAGGCSETPPSDAVPATSDRIPSLAGHFSLITVTTSWGEGRGRGYRTELELHRPDTAIVVAMSKRMLAKPKDLRLIGSERWSKTYPPEEAEWDAGTLYIGCRHCLDGSPQFYRITALSPRGFWGTWIDDQTGLVRNIDRDGKPLPHPSGYFCATRL